MDRRCLAVVAFGLGVVAAPMAFRFGGALFEPTPIVAQEKRVPAPNDSLDPFEEAAAVTVESEPGDLVTQFLRLSQQKARLLNPEELMREVEALKQELVELRATVELRAAEQQLQKLIGEHPQSKAAEKAKRMLDAVTPSPRF